MFTVCPLLSPVCGQRVGRGLVPEARGGGGGFLRHHLRHARGDQHGSRQGPETRRPEENLQSCKKSFSVLFFFGFKDVVVSVSSDSDSPPPR